MELSKELYSLIVDYIYQGYVSNNEELSKIKNDINEIINKNLDSISKALYFDKLISSIEDPKANLLLLDFVKNSFLNNSNLTIEEKIKLYFEAENFEFLNSQIKQIDSTKIFEYFGNRAVNLLEINKLISIFGVDFYKNIETLNIPDGILEISPLLVNSINMNTYIFMLNNYKKFTKKGVSLIVNNLYNLTSEKILEVLPYTEDSSLELNLVMPRDIESKLIILSKVNEQKFKELISEDDIKLIKEYILNNNPLPNGIMLNILKSFLSNDNIFNFSDEIILKLLNKIEINSLNFESLISINKRGFELITNNNENLKKFNISSIYFLVSNESPISFSKRQELIEYALENNLIDLKKLNINLARAIAKSISYIGVSSELFEKIALSKRFLILKVKLIDVDYINESKILEYLTNPIYYEQLNPDILINLLNKISKEKLLEILNNKMLLFHIPSNKFSEILNLEFDDIINNNLICEVIDRSYIYDKISYRIENEGSLKLLLNPNISKILFGKNFTITENDLEAIKYLIDYTFGLDLNSNTEDKFNMKTIESFAALYFLLGLKDSVDFINLYGIKLQIKDVLTIKDRILQAKVNTYRSTNAHILNGLYSNVIVVLNQMESPENIYDYFNDIYTWFIKYAKIYDKERMENLFTRYILLKNNPQKTLEETEKIKEEIRTFTEEIREKQVASVTLSYNEILMSKIKMCFKIKDSQLNKLTQKIQKKELILTLIDKSLSIMENDVKQKEKLLNALKSKTDLNGLCNFEEFVNEIFMKILSKTFDKKEFISNLGYKIPENYNSYLYDLRMIKYVNRANRLLSMYPNKKEVFEYLIFKRTTIDNPSNILNKMRYAFSRFEGHIKYDGEKIVCDLIGGYDEKECENYNIIVKKINKISKDIFNVLKEELGGKEELYITEEDIEDYLGELPVNDLNYDVKKKPISAKELIMMFNNFDFLNMEVTSKEAIKKFLYANMYNIRLISGTKDDEYYVKDFGYILSHFDKLFYICKNFGINIEEITIDEIRKLQDYIMLELTPLEETYGKKVITDIVSKTNLTNAMSGTQRLNSNSLIFEEALKRTRSSIPIIKTSEYEILDYHDPRIISSKMNDESCFAITGRGNNFSMYCILSKNGTVIFIKHPETGEDIGRVSAVRRGNTLFLHQLQIAEEYEESLLIRLHCEEVIQKLADDIIKATLSTEEPIEFVTITKLRLEDFSKNKELIDLKNCPYADDPIDVNTDDFKEISKNPLWRYEVEPTSFYHNYGRNYIISKAKDKTVMDIKDYDAKPVYIRRRKSPEIVNLKDPISLEESLKKYRKLLYLEARKSKDELESSRIAKSETFENLKKLYLGEDWCVIIYNTDEIKVIDLGYDERSKEEIAVVTEELQLVERKL